MNRKISKENSSKRDLEYMLTNDPSQVFSTYDLGLSAALLCAGFELLSLEKTNPRKALFVFKRGDLIEETSDKYFSDRLEVKARSYFDHLKAIKNQLYA
ncbi:hypothetical protein KGQ27_03405 [Patescibacteria group bacterium]|nr:hypothetical protein [Patescibacteria group bacterium]MDE1946900.1 hypothetical protein [Patescibacteria group bacterium]MDE2011101.1 hypothetical protein [Patescibacteria group bacterium]